MRLNYTAIVPLLFTLVAFILTLLCIFAGSKPGYVANGDMLTLNTSMLGHTTLNTSKTSSSLINSIASTIKGDINDVITTVTKDLGIHDFYSAHVMNYCEGYYTPTAFANTTVQPSQNITKCSNQTRMFHFDPAAVIQSELKPGVNLTSLKWPSAIEDGIHAIEVASKVMFVLYCMAAATAGVAFLGAIAGFLTGAKLIALANTLLCLIGFMASMVASAISTAIINNVVSTFNKHGNDIGIYAYKGMTFIGMTWAATILIILSAVAWIFESLLHKRRAAASFP
jgi:hypothetical protein